MGLCAVLLICLSQAELMRVWAQEQTGFGYAVSTDLGGASELRRTRREQHLLAEMDRTRAVRESLGGGLAIDTLPDNMTQVVEDSQRYYSWRSFDLGDPRTADRWIDLTSLEHGQVRIHGILSNTHRQAARVALSFDFPFYGHDLRQITIATGGFIFTGEITHRMLTATQYIAPLMANFDPSYSKNSTVQYCDNGEVFVVQWDHVRLQGREAEGAFTFQAALHRSGAITFSYRDVPMAVAEISSTKHPVKVGLSDAYMTYHNSPHVPEARRQTIYEYHRVEVDTSKITNHSIIEFTPLPTCLQHDSCESCLSSDLTSGCSWCNTIQRCSDGIDRHRQEWLDYGCSEEPKDMTCEDYFHQDSAVSIGTVYPSGSEPTPSPGSLLDSPVTEDLQTGPPRQQGAPVHTGIIAGVISAIVMLLALTLLALYINTHPTAAPAFYLIQRRSNHWPAMKFRNQGCHSSYTEVEVGGQEKEGFIEAEQC
ncbi:plexin domain-containing protein 1 isoform X2 [Amia ocellicauda]|uniref:plexin domain-containing protein 1 isoform X2 n=1 Tax=Amia ocellicauda TaxID=2972642 RepID=UPI003463B958